MITYKTIYIFLKKFVKDLIVSNGTQSTMKRYKTLHIITRFLRGGTEKNVLSTIAALESQRFNVEIIVGRDSDLSLMSKSIEALKINSLVRSANPIRNIQAFFDLYKIIRKGKYHIVHTHQANAGAVGRIASKFAGVPVIVHGLHGSTFHGDQNFFVRQFYILLEKVLAKITTCYTVVGYDLRDRYLNEGIGGKDDYFVIRSGMDLKRFYDVYGMSDSERGRKRKDLGFNGGEVLITIIAALEPRKGHLYLLEVARRIKNNNVKFLFVGEGWSKEKLREKVRELDLEGNIKFLGYREDVENVMAASDIIALTSLWEGLPQVLVQAAAAGKPMVSFAVEGATEVIKEGINGFIVPVKDVEVFERKLRYLIENPNIAVEMGKRGKGIIGDEWELSKMQDKVVKLYDALINTDKI
jgi:glycosyltransferase involved in cell wall biosynthesis